MSIAPERALQTDAHITEQQRKRLRKLWDGLLSVAYLPAGAVDAADWEGESPPERVVLGPELRVTGCPIVVQVSAVQNAMGSLRERIVSVDGHADRGLQPWQARVLAAQLLAAADTVDGWAGR